MALNTGGFALSALPRSVNVPSNIGKVDAGAMYDRIKQGLDSTDALRTTLARQQLEDEQIKAAQSQALAQQQVFPAQGAADVATAHRTAALASPAIVGGEVAKTTTGLDADLLAEQQRRDNAKFLGTLSAPQRMVLASQGPSMGTTNTTTRNANGNTQSVSEKTAFVGGTPVPLARSSTEYPSTPVITPFPQGPNGISMGGVITAVGPDGKPVVQHYAAPLAALNNINAGTTYQQLGTRRDEQGNTKYVVQAYTQSAAGGAPKPVGAPVEVNSLDGLPGLDPRTSSQTQTQPFISKDAANAIADEQSEINTLSTRKIEMQNIANAATAFTEDTTGRFIGPIRGFLGDAKAQEFVGSVQNALSTALQPLRGTGRVSNTEFNQALSALPKITDQPETIKNKIQYLNLIADWALSRHQAILDNLGKGQNRYQAYQQAQKDTPLPEVPNFYAGETVATPAPAPAAVPAAAAPTAAANHPQDAEAVAWAKANPQDPKSAEILKLNGL